MSDCMHFPDTVEEFMEQYKMTDAKQVYSNGIEYVPIFRMEQWFKHEKTQLSREGKTSAQPERKKGEWSDGYRWQRCSLCKQTGKKSWNFCPNCGADMRGEKDG